MWDAATGSKQYTFEGHEAPVYSVCPHTKENVQVYICSRLTLWLEVSTQGPWEESVFKKWSKLEVLSVIFIFPYSSHHLQKSDP